MFLCVSFPAYAQTEKPRFISSIEDSQWQLTSDSPILCRLEHVIPRFGKAVFTQAAGRKLALELVSTRRFASGLPVDLVSEPAGWQSMRPSQLMASLKTRAGDPVVKVPAAATQLAYADLRSGRQPGFSFSGDDAMLVSLSTVRFQTAEESFSACRARLHPLNFDDIRVSHIHFDANQEFPRLAEEKSAFNRMFAYLKIDDSISEILVTGHSDVMGEACVNERLSEGRAWYVYDLLVARGIDASMLRVDFAGESRPLSKGLKKESLAANRRVSVELRR